MGTDPQTQGLFRARAAACGPSHGTKYIRDTASPTNRDHLRHVQIEVYYFPCRSRFSFCDSGDNPLDFHSQLGDLQPVQLDTSTFLSFEVRRE